MPCLFCFLGTTLLLEMHFQEMKKGSTAFEATLKLVYNETVVSGIGLWINCSLVL